MRSPLWFVVAGVIALASFVAAALYVMPRLGALDEGTIRIVVPGSTVFTLGKPGHYTIFHERRSQVDGRYYESRSLANGAAEPKLVLAVSQGLIGGIFSRCSISQAAPG